MQSRRFPLSHKISLVLNKTSTYTVTEKGVDVKEKRC